MAGWIKLEEALGRKKKPFPQPWNYIEASRSGIGSIGAALDFGSSPCPGREKPLPVRIIIFNCHKEVTGPVMTYWYVMWHKDYGYKEFDVRWLWKFLGEVEPIDWNSYDPELFTEYIFRILGEVRGLFLRCPETLRNEMAIKIGTGVFLDEEDPFPATKRILPVPPCLEPVKVAEVLTPAPDTKMDEIYVSVEGLGNTMRGKAYQARETARKAHKKGDFKKWDKFNAVARVYEMSYRKTWPILDALHEHISVELRDQMIPF